MSAGAKTPPKLSAKVQTTIPQNALAIPASRDQYPRGATISKTPRPTWIHTAEAGTVIGWLLQIVAPAFTTCCTHTGELAAVGSITWVVMPSGIED